MLVSTSTCTVLETTASFRSVIKVLKEKDLGWGFGWSEVERKFEQEDGLDWIAEICPTPLHIRSDE